jgi:hypothetical protein
MTGPSTPSSQPAVAAQSGNPLGILLAFVAALPLIFAVLVRRAPDRVLEKQFGAAARGLERHPFMVAAAGLLLLLLAVMHAVGDFRASSAAAYVPSSARVRAVRSLLAAALMLAGFLFLWLAASRNLFFFARSAIEIFAAGIIPWLGAAWAYNAACLRPPMRTYPAPPSFREAVDVLSCTYDFLLGYTGVHDWKTVSPPLRWFRIPSLAMFTNIFIFGGIGSGKTATALKPLLEQALAKFPGDREQKVGLFVVDGTKGSLTEHVRERAQLAGRAADIVEITIGGKWSYNPIADGSPTALASKLLAALEVMTAQESHSYYKKMQREFAENALSILTEVLGSGRFTMRDLYDFICDETIQTKTLEAAAPKNSISYRWFKTQWEKEDPHERIELTKGFRADLSLFVRDEIAPTFCDVDANFPGWRAFLDEGKILIFNMDLSTWGELTRAMGIFLLMDFQRAMIARSQPSFKRAGGNTSRLVLAAIDEAWAFMNRGLAEFTAVSRESRCCTIALTQSLDQIPPAYRATVIGNFRTAVLLSVQDPLTLKTYSDLLGTHRTVRESVSESSGYSGVEQRLFSDSLLARAGGESRSLSRSTQDVDEPRFSATDLLHLPEATAAVLMFDGKVVRTARAVKLLPSYLPEFQLWGAP